MIPSSVTVSNPASNWRGRVTTRTCISTLHLWTGWSAATARYDAAPPLTTLAATDWRSSGWQREPANRVLLDGDPGEPMLLQTSRPLAELVTAFEAAGWNASQVTLSGEILSAVLPSRQTLDLRAPWPLRVGDAYQDGQQ